MVQEADKYEARDHDVMEKVKLMNSFEKCAYNIRDEVNDQKFAGNLNPEDKQKIEKAIDEALDWIESRELAEVEEIEDKWEKLEEFCIPIINNMFTPDW